MVLFGLFESFGLGAPEVLELGVADELPLMAPLLLAAPLLQLLEIICTFPTFRLVSPELVPEMET